MSEIKIAAALPKGEADGLGTIVRAAITEPETVHTIILLVDTKKTTTDIDTGDVVPTLRIRRAEAVTGSDIRDANRLIRRAVEKRTGQATLDIEVEDELEQMFRAMDLKQDAEQPEDSDDGE